MLSSFRKIGMIAAIASFGAFKTHSIDPPSFRILIGSPLDGAIISGPKFETVLQLHETGGLSPLQQPPGNMMLCVDLNSFPSQGPELADPMKLPRNQLLSKPSASCYEFNIDLESNRREWEATLELAVPASGWYRLEVVLEEHQQSLSQGDSQIQVDRSLHAYTYSDNFISAPSPGQRQSSCFSPEVFPLVPFKLDSRHPKQTSLCIHLDNEMMIDLASMEDVYAKYVGLDMTIGGECGWGVAAANIALEIIKYGMIPVPVLQPAAHGGSLTAEQRALLSPAMEIAAPLFLNQHLHDLKNLVLPFPIIHAMGLWGENGSIETTGFHFSDQKFSFWGSRNYGIVFSEETPWTEQNAFRLNKFDKIFAGSKWNLEMLLRAGLDKGRSSIFPQGVDTALFSPQLQPGVHMNEHFPDKDSFFDIFSGGKLEYRKGQDLVVKAFEIFSRTHPDARLVVAWDNKWNTTIASILESPHTKGMPALLETGELPVSDWLEENGIPRSRVIDLGSIPHRSMGSIFHYVDVAVFPNRCEGGTNLVAMESIASGVPTILSANTGHLDIIEFVGDANSFALRDQVPLNQSKYYGWCESSVMEIVNYLENIYSEKITSVHKSLNAASWMTEWSWTKSVHRLLVDSKIIIE